ncbi:indolepyruvate ferredoxin oxidoreductase family protein [Chthonobacter albigriseus]|uniref:indolepyruvate ferredoxin oxidoreductase family protein n=1 Tax=Chthonobacter albigriseus TaxID=1683161 RepID=UPI0015EECA14|nr:indolepyruvate ferredoxin oxidoreductase family protein [Chthonobacter albigriseus]
MSTPTHVPAIADPFPGADRPLVPISLDDKYDLTRDRIFVSGAQAVVRLCLMQRDLDRRAGLRTAGYVSGYPGSPLGGIDGQFNRAKSVLDAADIRFQLGLNEELAATAVWGTQGAGLRGESRTDGVFALWYGKGPGVDRCGDVFRHANFAGTARNGGVLALMGDDHNAESSSTAHQSEFHFVDVMIPILHPAGVQEIIDFGLYGWALSRFAGTWVSMKCVKDNIESTAIIDGSLDRLSIVTPGDFAMPPGGLNIRLGDDPLSQEARLHDWKRDAVLAFVHENRLNRIVTSGGSHPRIGIATVGKSYLDVLEALSELGISLERADDLGIRLFKIACPWPLSRLELAEFARGLELAMIVEEKRSLVEVQFREELFGLSDMPVCIGKKDERGDWLFPVKGALDPNRIAIAIAERLLARFDLPDVADALERLRRVEAAAQPGPEIAVRRPHFCSGCPHNTSTVLPDGARGSAGIGCHYMVQWMDRGTEGTTQMGGEGAHWIGEAPFSTRPHIFQNLGDGTYNHSGSLAIRAAVAAGTTITYKLLYNDAVAMTGGQAHAGGLTVDRIAREIAALGVARLVLVSDDPGRYPSTIGWPAPMTIHPREDLMAVQTELAATPGVTVLIYDQTCAAEKRRRRKRGTYPDPKKRVFINELVCEGCGDCGRKSNCVSIQPVETEFGRKRMIDQSNCNKDYSCLKGFCPSFVTVENAEPRRHAGTADAAALDRLLAGLPAPTVREPEGTWNILATGIGGTGIVTIGAILGMAAHLEGKGCGIIDMAGLAQKGGAVVSHIRLARRQDDIKAIRVSAGHADLVLGFDVVTAGTRKTLAAAKPGRTAFLVNTAAVMPGDFTRDPDFDLPVDDLLAAIGKVGGEVRTFDMTAIATALLGNSIAANMMLLGVASQAGLLPVSHRAIEAAIAMNGEAVPLNLEAFRWGRVLAVEPGAADPAITAPAEAVEPDLEALVDRRAAFLTAYQNTAWADRYRTAIGGLAAAEARVGGSGALARTAARALFKLMSYKDEYEVARLFTEGSFERKLADSFEGEDMKLRFHLAPPLLARRDPTTGEPRKMSFGPWMLPVFRLLSRGRVLRGSPLDPFGWTAERRMERRLIAEYEGILRRIADGLPTIDLGVAEELAALPLRIRGFGHVKAEAARKAALRQSQLLTRLHPPAASAAGNPAIAVDNKVAG